MSFKALEYVMLTGGIMLLALSIGTNAGRTAGDRLAHINTAFVAVQAD